MLAKSHVLSAVAVSLPLTIWIPQEELIFYLIAVVIGSLFPDLDEEGSFLSRRVYIVSYLISMFSEHRGWTHTMMAIVLYSLAGTVAIFYNFITVWMLIGFIIGVLMHLMGDMCTKSGLKIAYPLSNKRFHILPKSMLLYTGKNVEVYFIIPMLGSAVALGIYLFVLPRIMALGLQ